MVEKVSDCIKLSICIATFNRAKFIGETLNSISPQLTSVVELIVLDGASSDETFDVMSGYVERFSKIRYFREERNSGLDRDYDKAVNYARGEYCWLMTDDDLLRPGAVNRVLKEISESIDLVIVNSEVRTVDLSIVLSPCLLPAKGPTEYSKTKAGCFFSEIGGYLSFIGAVVIKRNLWLARERENYFGTLFIHVGVIFQEPIEYTIVIREPLIVIRYGNAMWTPRGFEIWMSKWPGLVWSFRNYSDTEKSRICFREPWRELKKLVFYRSIGSYKTTDYYKFIAQSASPIRKVISYGVACIPIRLANLVATLYCAFINKKARAGLYDLTRSPHAGWISKYISRKLLK